MRHQQSSPRPPRWLTFAAKVRTRISRLRRNKTYQERRNAEVYRSYHEVKEKYRYVGTLGDWDFIVAEAESLPGKPKL